MAFLTAATVMRRFHRVLPQPSSKNCKRILASGNFYYDKPTATTRRGSLMGDLVPDCEGVSPPLVSTWMMRHVFSKEQQEVQQPKHEEKTADINYNNNNDNNNKSDTMAEFPWRHNSQLTPRVELEMMRVSANWRGRLALALVERSSAIMMNYDFTKIIGRQWRQDLADSMAWAFCYGLATLFSDIFKVPIDDLFSTNGDDVEFNFVYTTPFTATTPSYGKNEPTNDDKASMHIGSENGKDASTSSSSETNHKSTEPTTSEELDSLVEKNLVELYRAFYKKFHDGNSSPVVPLEITLSLRPVDASLWRLVCYPFLSRAAVEEDGKRKSHFHWMFAQSREQGLKAFMHHLWDFADQMLAERGVMETTMTADVIVDCVETFQVKDLKNNKILQGDGMERTVRHVIRMECDVTLVEDESGKFGEWIVGNWRLADIDDHLIMAGKMWTPTNA